MSDIVARLRWVVVHGDKADAIAAIEFAVDEIERLRDELARPLLVRGRGIYSAWGLETGLLVGRDGDAGGARSGSGDGAG